MGGSSSRNSEGGMEPHFEERSVSRLIRAARQTCGSAAWSDYKMSNQNDLQCSITRRQLLAAGAAGAALLTAPTLARADRKSDLARYAPFLMGIQSYSLRGFGLDDALEKTKALGLHYWEAFQAHIPRTEDPTKIKETLAKLAA